MTRHTVRLIQNLSQWLHRATWEDLYHVAECLAGELAERGQDASLEARALQCALLPLAHAQRGAIYSERCDDPRPVDLAWLEYMRELHSRPES